MNVTVRLEIFSRPQEIENSRQYLLLRTDIYRKQSLGASGSYTSAQLFTHTAISRKAVGKNLHATIPKGSMGYDQFTVPDTVAFEPTFVAFL